MRSTLDAPARHDLRWWLEAFKGLSLALTDPSLYVAEDLLCCSMSGDHLVRTSWSLALDFLQKVTYLER